MNKDNILSLINTHKEEIRKFGLLKIGLFGSYIRDEQKDSSDIDILAEFEKGKKTYKNFIHLCFYLDDLFKGKKVEVVTLEGLSPYLKPYIEKEVVYEKLC